MKNIHKINNNIYITSDEEIKEGDYMFDISEMTVYECIGQGVSGYKIILTTDKDLIGVQTIDDKFLEWFVKNPSCEFVKTDLVPVNEFGSEITVKGYGFDKFIYKIIIPQEEPKQEKCYTPKSYYSDESPNIEKDVLLKMWNAAMPKLETKQETLEEAAEYYAHNYFDMHETNNYKALKQGFDAGAKWQAEIMYEIMYEIMNSYADDVMGGCNLRAEEWFEQFKKK